MNRGNGRNVILCCLLLISAGPAVDPPASAYLVSTTGAGKEIKWPVQSVSYVVNAAGSPAGSLEGIRSAMQTWTDVGSSSFVFAYAGTTTASSHGKNDGQNIVTFAHMGSNGTLAENAFWYTTGTGELLDSDIRFNTNYPWSTDVSPTDYDVQNIGTHEFGHSLSLDDLYGDADAEKTMYGYGSPGETKKRTLDPDDVAGVAHLYPKRITIGDFDGDGKTDIAVWRPGSGIWYVYRSSDNTLVAQQWGLESLGDVPVAGDYDGDGKVDVAVWRKGTGTWYVHRSSDNGVTSCRWGSDSLGDIPVPGDYDGDGKTDIAVWRPSGGYWFIQRSSVGVFDYDAYPGDRSPALWGMATDIPVPGDYDGDGTTDIAVWRQDSGVWYVLRSSDGGMRSLQWGMPGDVPAAGHYDNDAVLDIAVWRPSTGIWYILRSSDGGMAAAQWGISGDTPVAGDYDGDGRTDVAVWRSSTGVWYINRSTDGGMTAVQWGDPGDEPATRF